MRTAKSVPARMSRMLPRLVCAALVALAGCKAVDDGPVDGSGRTPVNPKPPTGAEVDRLSVSASWPEDSDVNGYPDLITVTVYMFDSRQSYVSLQLPGKFSAALIANENGTTREFRTWELTEAQTERAARKMAVGPGYVFPLSLNENGGDKVPTQSVDLVVTFIPKEGKPVRSRGATSLRVGRGGLGGSR